MHVTALRVRKVLLKVRGSIACTVSWFTLVWKAFVPNYCRRGSEHTFFRNTLRRNLFLFDHVLTNLRILIIRCQLLEVTKYGSTELVIRTGTITVSSEESANSRGTSTALTFRFSCI